MTDTPSIKTAVEALQSVIDPETGKSIIRCGYVRGLEVTGRSVSLSVVLPEPGHPLFASASQACEAALRDALGAQIEVHVETDAAMIGLADTDKPKGLEQVRNVIAVASGKGGVGKSTVAANLAVALARDGHAVGLVDTDIYGPSIPTMFGVRDSKPRVLEGKIVPIERHGVQLLSMGFLVDPDKAVIWRGPMVSSAVRQFLADTAWGALDYLIMDLPPGTGDIQLTIVQTVPLTGAVVVSTPQTVALADARKGVAMFDQVDVPVLGLVENMAYFQPPDMPDRRYFIFGKEGARRLAEELKVPLLAEVPLEEHVREGGDEGEPVLVRQPDSASGRAFARMAVDVVEAVDIRNATAAASDTVEIVYR